jgi:hypothetical protein
VPEFENERGEPRLIILDDLLNNVYYKYVCDIFTKGSHHRNISFMLIIQNQFQGQRNRHISMNVKYLVVYKNVRDKNQFVDLARQVYPENSNSLLEKYLEATKGPHDYLLFCGRTQIYINVTVQVHMLPKQPHNCKNTHKLQNPHIHTAHFKTS